MKLHPQVIPLGTPVTIYRKGRTDHHIVLVFAGVFLSIAVFFFTSELSLGGMGGIGFGLIGMFMLVVSPFRY